MRGVLVAYCAVVPCHLVHPGETRIKSVCTCRAGTHCYRQCHHKSFSWADWPPLPPEPICTDLYFPSTSLPSKASGEDEDGLLQCSLNCRSSWAHNTKLFPPLAVHWTEKLIELSIKHFRPSISSDYFILISEILLTSLAIASWGCFSTHKKSNSWRPKSAAARKFYCVSD